MTQATLVKFCNTLLALLHSAWEEIQSSGWQPRYPSCNLFGGCMWKALCLKFRAALNPWHCPGWCSNPDLWGSSARRRQRRARRDAMMPAWGGPAICKGKDPQLSHFSHLWLCPRRLLPGPVMAPSRARVTSELCWPVWTMRRQTVDLFLKENPVVRSSFTQSGMSTLKDRRGRVCHQTPVRP